MEPDEKEERRADQFFLAQDHVARMAKQYAWLTWNGHSIQAIRIWTTMADYIHLFCAEWGMSARETLDGIFNLETKTALAVLDAVPKVLGTPGPIPRPRTEMVDPGSRVRSVQV